MLDEILIITKKIAIAFLVSGARKSFKKRYNIDEATCAKQDEWL